MKLYIRKFWNDTSGQDLVEYALVAGMVAGGGGGDRAHSHERDQQRVQQGRLDRGEQHDLTCQTAEQPAPALRGRRLQERIETANQLRNRVLKLHPASPKGGRKQPTA